MSKGMGAAVYFLGVVRDSEQGQSIKAARIRNIPAHAEHQFHLLFDEIEKRWPIEAIRVVHRIGIIT